MTDVRVVVMTAAVATEIRNRMVLVVVAHDAIASHVNNCLITLLDFRKCYSRKGQNIEKCKKAA